ncbi:MAG: chloride channel protein [Chitinophagaceae bacterium]
MSVFSDGKIRTSVLHAIPFWVASLLTGLIAVGYTKTFNFLEGLMHGMVQDHSWSIFILAPLGLILGWIIVEVFAPGARGSGIPQVMAAMELPSARHKESFSKLLSVKIIFVKILSSLVIILGGGAIGREGPTIQISGSIFRMMHHWIPASWPRLSRQNFIITGAAAGLAAAFNTPLGGIVFAIEEIAKIHLSFFRTALFTAVIIAGLTAQNFLGPYLYLGYPDIKSLEPLIFIFVIVAAIISGFLGALMSRWILLIMRWRKTLSRWESLFFLLGCGLFIACMAFFVDSAILGSGKDVMNEALFTADKHVPWHTAFMRILGPIVVFNSGGAGGVFAPALAAGAALGGWLSGVFGFFGANANILILSGMVGFLTGVTRTPFTSAILVLEMTDRHSVIFHLMIAGIVANIVALMVDKHALYDYLKQDFLADAKRDIAEADGAASAAVLLAAASAASGSETKKSPELNEPGDTKNDIEP